MKRLILHYDTEEGLEMLMRCYQSYQQSENATRSGMQSGTVYSNEASGLVCYFITRKTGTVTGTIFEQPEKPEEE